MNNNPLDSNTKGEGSFHHPALTEAQEVLLTRFAACLQAGNQKANLTRIVETSAIYLRHFADALQGLPLLDRYGPSGRLLDVGSGPGVPGLVLACARPSWSITSLEATGKKVAFQESVVADLGLTNVEVLKGRAEEWAHTPEQRESYDIVTARAVAAMPVLLELCVPFLKPGGYFLAFKGPDAEEELAASQAALQSLGASVDEVQVYSLKTLSEDIDVALPPEDVSFRLVIVQKECTTPSFYPRAYGVMRRKPLS